MLLTTENSTQQINAALLDLEKETKSNTKNSIISTVYAIIKGFFDELKQKIGTTGIWSVTQAEYDSLTTSERLEDKYYNVTDASTGFLSVTNTVENGNTQPVTSNAVYGALTNLDVVENYTKSVTKSDVGYSDSINVCNLEAGHTYLINCLFELTSSIDDVFVGMIYIGTERYYVRFNGLAGGGACISKAVAITSTKTLKCGFYNNVSNNVMCTFSFDVVKLK